MKLYYSDGFKLFFPTFSWYEKRRPADIETGHQPFIISSASPANMEEALLFSSFGSMEIRILAVKVALIAVQSTTTLYHCTPKIINIYNDIMVIFSKNCSVYLYGGSTQ